MSLTTSGTIIYPKNLSRVFEKLKVPIASLIIGLLLHGSGHSQKNESLLLDLKPKPFSLRNSILSIGFGISGSLSFNDGTTLMTYFIGDKPKDVTFGIPINNVDTEVNINNLNVDLIAELYSPNSSIGLVSGITYNIYHFSFSNGRMTSTFEIDRIVIPLLLNIRFGKIHSQKNWYTQLGLSYALPIRSKVDFDSISKTFHGVESNFLVSYIFGKQFRLVGQKGIDSKILKGSMSGDFSRILVFLKGDILLFNLFSESADLILDGYANNRFDHRDINISIGASFFFGFNQQKI